MEENNKKGKSISSFSIIIIALSLFLLGLFFVPKLSVKLNPSRKIPVVNVSFNMWGQSPLVVEMEATSKLEGMLSRVKGVQHISSRSGHGWGHVSLRLSEHVDPEMARFEISTIVRQAWASLPEGVTYPSIHMSGTTEEANHPFLRYTINAPYSAIDIQEYVEQHIKTRLADIRGLERIEVNGASPMILRLQYDYTQLDRHGITLNDIRSAIQSYLSKEFLGIGKIEAEDGRKEWIRLALVAGEQKQEFDASLISVKNQEGTIIRLDQLVKVRYEEEETVSHFRINGLNSIYLSVTAETGANQLKLSQKIQQLLKDMEECFPAGYELHLSYDAAVYINKELQKIWFRSGLTILILLFFVFLTYRNIKYSFLVIFSLLTNVSVAAILYYLLHIEMQLYSLAGLTISLTLIIDNVIIMADQIIHRKNKKVFLAILTATLTTLAALMIIFFMEENIRLNLEDFAWVIIINLSISLVVAFLLVPALIEKLKLTGREREKNKNRNFFLKKGRGLVYFTRIYARVICSMYRRRKWILAALLLLFGLPVIFLPSEIKPRQVKNHFSGAHFEELRGWENLYNKTLGSAFYKEKIKPVSDVALGGTMRLFAEKVRVGGYSSGERAETTLFVVASLPNGSTKTQMNALIKKMEDYISLYKEVRQFETHVHNGQRASIQVFFQEKYQRGKFPNYLKSQLITRALELGGGTWSVHGVGDGFNNEVKEQAGMNRIKLLGYNYDNLQLFAGAMRDSLLQHRRIHEVTIDSEFNWYKNDYEEFALITDKEKLIQRSLVPSGLLNSLHPMFEKNMWVDNWVDKNRVTPIRLFTPYEKIPDMWDLQHLLLKLHGRENKITEIASMGKKQVARDIAKENQQYVLCLQYDYIGDFRLSEKVLEQTIENFNRSAPLGYHAEREFHRSWWGENGLSQYWLLFIIVTIIFFTTSILLDSMTQPFVVVFIIPLSFIGIFLTFYWFELNFDQGGFAAFILLAGTTVNANIYLLNEYNNIRRSHASITPLKAYLKAWNVKIRPIMLTVISTILGFIPFLVGPHKESFWFPLAAGTIGGMIASVIALFLFLPLFMGVGKKN